MLSGASHFAAIFGIPLFATLTYALLTVSIMTVTYCLYAWRGVQGNRGEEQQDGEVVELNLSSPSPILKMHEDRTPSLRRNRSPPESVDQQVASRHNIISCRRHESGHEAEYDINQESGAVYIVPINNSSTYATVDEDHTVAIQAVNANTSTTGSNTRENTLYLTML